ncbi:MAG: hypothetical protein JO046_15980 [Solirubrobacterales bacterium]|nr:hypothetical protein [Solirubrobacterales bacterium]
MIRDRHARRKAVESEMVKKLVARDDSVRYGVFVAERQPGVRSYRLRRR